MHPTVRGVAQQSEQDLRRRERVARRAMPILDRHTIVMRHRVEVPTRQVREELARQAHRAELSEQQLTERRRCHARELGAQEPEVEARVVRHEYAADQMRCELPGDVREGRGITHHGIVDAGEPRDLPRDRSPGIHERMERQGHVVPIDMHRRHLGDAIGTTRLPAGRLDVDHDIGERVQFHGAQPKVLRAPRAARIVAGGPIESGPPTR